MFQKSPDNRMPKAGVVHVSVGADDNHVNVIPTEFIQVFFANG
jgi:hypothetical protein